MVKTTVEVDLWNQKEKVETYCAGLLTAGEEI
jgi:hypothetical protein